MIFAIEAVDFDTDGVLQRVRWHSLEYADGIVNGPSEVLPVAQAVQRADGHTVHVCFEGAAGSTVLVGDVGGRATFVDSPDVPPGQQLAVLPRIDT
ncbi:MAG: hypothetical protein KA795_01830 [Burkholderiaceae bacterium]|nr:hypothetical protein [Burkholderiaceae bacterium]